MTPKQKRLQMQLMNASIAYTKLLTSLHNIRNAVLDDTQDATMVEEAIYALDTVSKLRSHLREKYQLSKIKEQDA